MKKLGMIFLILFITGVESCLYAMEKPVAVKPQVKDVNEAPADVQARAKQYTDLQNKAYKTDQAKTDAVKDLYNVDSSVTPTFSGISKEQMSINLSDTTQIESTFDGWNGKLKESRLTQFNPKNKQIVDSRTITTLKSNGELTEAIYKNFKADGASKISQMIEYHDDGSFTITNYGKDNLKTDTTTYKANVKAQIEAQPLSPRQQAIVDMFRPKADKYAENPSAENGKELTKSMVEEVTKEQNISITPEQKQNAIEVAEQLLSKVDTKNPNWFTDFVKIAWDSLLKFLKLRDNQVVEATSQSNQADQAHSSAPDRSLNSVNLLDIEQTASAVSDSSTPTELFPNVDLAPKTESIQDQKPQLQVSESQPSVQQPLFSEPVNEQAPAQPSQSQFEPISTDTSGENSPNLNEAKTVQKENEIAKDTRSFLEKKAHWFDKRSKALIEKSQNIVSSASTQLMPQAAQ